MSFLRNNIILSVLLISQFILLSTQATDNIIIYSKDDSILTFCHNDAYHIKFGVQFSKPLDKIIPFEIVLPLPNRLPFKCIIDGPKSNVYCFHSFNNYIWSIAQDTRMEIPYSFPFIDGIRWDYDTFLRKVYRYLWRVSENCGLSYSSSLAGGSSEGAKLIADVSEISGGKCYASKYDYAFNMKLNFEGGEYLDELKKAKEDKKNMKIIFLNKIYVPILIGDKKEKGQTTFRKDYEYKYAICSYDKEINQNNYNVDTGFIFDCHLSVNRYIKFKGPLQIKPFTDLLYVSKTDIDGKVNNNLIQIKFNILSSSNVNSTETKRNLQNTNINTEPNFLILDSNLNTFICPDIPTLSIVNYNKGIQFGGISSTGSKFLFLLNGYLSNGFDYINGTLSLLDMTKEEIKFFLTVTDNLEPDLKKKLVKCTIPSGSSINKNILIEVRCIGARPHIQSNNNTDLTLNWASEANNDFKNILIRWPYDLTKKKHIFFYDIKGLSVKQSDFGCFENKFFFYLYVYDLKAEPKISFYLPLTYPKGTKAVCKLYNSVTFKCIIDLRLKRLSKGEKVIISNEENKFVGNTESNIVLYKVNNDSETTEFNFVIPVEENCGDFMIVGALKDIGYTYLQVILIIICTLVGIALVIFGIVFCVIYEITHRNRKGPYFRHTEELPNTSVTQPNNNLPKKE